MRGRIGIIDFKWHEEEDNFNLTNKNFPKIIIIVAKFSREKWASCRVFFAVLQRGDDNDGKCYIYKQTFSGLKHTMAEKQRKNILHIRIVCIVHWPDFILIFESTLKHLIFWTISFLVGIFVIFEIIQFPCQLCMLQVSVQNRFKNQHEKCRDPIR